MKIKFSIIYKKEKYKELKWQLGNTYFFGREKNNIFRFFDNNSLSIRDVNKNTNYLLSKVVDNFWNFIKSQDKIPDKFNNFSSKDIFDRLCHALTHYLKFTREIVFEEVRKEFFFTLPSRQRCIWVIPEDKNAVQYWWKLLGESGKIYKVELTGKIHFTNQEYLGLNTSSLDYIRQQAFKYWAGVKGKNTYESECLFEGFVKVIDDVSINNFV